MVALIGFITIGFIITIHILVNIREKLPFHSNNMQTYVFICHENNFEKEEYVCCIVWVCNQRILSVIFYIHTFFHLQKCRCIQISRSLDLSHTYLFRTFFYHEFHTIHFWKRILNRMSETKRTTPRIICLSKANTLSLLLLFPHRLCGEKKWFHHSN